MHNGFLNIDNKKMSKSAGNFFTVRDIAEKYDLQVLRFFMLSAHYRSPLNFSADLMEAAKNGLDRILTAVSKLKLLLENSKEIELTEEEKSLLERVHKLEEKFDNAMDDDFNTADAISAIFEIVKESNSHLNENSSKEVVTKVKESIESLCDILGIITEKEEELLDSDIESLIEERQLARKNKDFKRADAIREELLQKGIILEDTRQGVTWKRA